MSGTNKLIVSENAMKRGSESALSSCLENANEEALRILKIKKEDKKKPVKK